MATFEELLGVEITRAREENDGPTFEWSGASKVEDGEIQISFTMAAGSPLAGVSLSHRAFAERLEAHRDEQVLAEVDARPVWTSGPRGDRVALGLGGFVPNVPLREQLTAGRFLPLVSLLHFARRVSSAWLPPPIRSAFLFDDPNLHAGSYGYLDFSAVVAASPEFHLAIAMIPLDAWYAARTARALFRENSERLSIVCHGNDHLRRELARDHDRAVVRSRLAQALRRIARFERRYAVPVERVMAPPHGVCSEIAAEEMLALGFEALCISRPYPWLAQPPPERKLAGISPNEVVVGGLPVVPRLRLDQPRRDLPLRAFLGQPIVLYGHHEDLAGGMETLASVAQQVEKLGPVHWSSLGSIARSSYESRTNGSTLEIRLHARRVHVALPSGVEQIVVKLGFAPSGEALVRLRAASGAQVEEPLANGVASFGRPAAQAVEVEVVSGSPIRPEDVRPPRASPWPLARRTATESRDRLRARGR